MKHCFLKALFLIAATSVLFSLSSCEKVNQQDETVSVYLTYTITTDNGEAMPGTKASSADVFDEFYQKIKSGDLVAPNYSFTFTEKTTGAVYIVDGTWAGKDMVTLRTGTYSVVGTSTAAGENIQDKCSLIFDDEITVDVNSTTIILKANYDCSLIIFSDASIAKLSNFNGNSSTDLFKLNNYIYAFIRTKLYADGKQDQAYLEGTHTNDTKFKIYTGSLNYEIGKYYVYNDINAAFNLEKMEEGGSESDGAVNLSSNGTANCYIVPSAGLYKFRAIVKGNSEENLDGTPASADVLWESFGTAEKPKEGDVIASATYSNGYVYFSTPNSFHEGNAVIAVKDEAGTILWSWHIWLTSYSPINEYEVYASSGIVSMNRNLGALSNEKGKVSSFGLFYQNGRKDPFLNSVSAYGGLDVICDHVSATNETNIPITLASGTVSIDYAVKHPTEYISNSSNYRWIEDIDELLWDESKTKYDPCPVGWKVLSSSAWQSCYQSFSWDRTNNGMTLPSSVCSPSPWFPAAGGIYNNCRLTNVGPYCLYWTANDGLWMHYGGYIEWQSDRGHMNPDGRTLRCCAE